MTADMNDNKGPRDDRWYLPLMAPNTKGEKFAWLDPTSIYINATAFTDLLDDIQASLFQHALDHREQNTCDIDTWDEFKAFFTPENSEKPEMHGGFAHSHWCDAEECENKINDELSVTIRTVPFDRASSGEGSCILCGKSSSGRVVFAKSY